MTLLTVKQAAERAGGISESLVYEWCRRRQLPHYRLGVNGKGKIMIAAADLDAFLESCKVDESRGDCDEVLKHIR